MNIDSDIELPTEVQSEGAPAKVTKTRKPRKQKEPPQPKPADALIEAIKYISLAQKRSGEDQITHCFAIGGWIAASDGIVTMATPITDNLNCCPHSHQLLTALAKCGHDLSITQVSHEVLSVRSGEFHALVPCTPHREINIPGPDDNVAAVNEELRKAIAAVAVCVKPKQANPIYSSVVVQNNTVVATNGHIIMEAWHGIYLPDGLSLPKSSAQVLAKIKKQLTGFGFSQSSITFYFADGSWMKSQLYADKFPPYRQILDIEIPHYWPIPQLFFTAVKMVLPFASSGNIFFEGQTVQTGGLYVTKEHREGASYQIQGLPDGYSFNGDYLSMLQSFAETAYFAGLPDSPKMFFFGGIVRGCLMGLEVRKTPEHSTYVRAHSVESHIDSNGFDDDVPF